MINNTTRKKLGIATIIAILCVVAVVFAIPFGAKADTPTLDIIASYGLNMTCSSSVPSSSGLRDNRKGLLLSGKKNGGKAVFKNSFAGDFDIDFRVYSDETFSGSPTSPIYRNDALDLQTLRFNFTNEDGRKFSVLFFGGAAGALTSPNVCVEYNGTRAGIYYDYFGNVVGTTKFNNGKSVYTTLEGTSFCNLANIGDEYSTSECESTVLRFNPETMSVYAFGNGYPERLVWTMANSENDGFDAGFTLDPFTNYTVETVFESIGDGKTAKMLINEVNGTDFNWHYLANVSTSLFADFVSNAAAGENYVLPALRSSTLAGTVAGDYTVTVTDPEGNGVAVADNAFTPEKSGTYKIVYKLGSAEKTYELEAYAKDKPASFGISDRYNETEFGVGATINVYPATYSSEKLRVNKARTALVSVYGNGEIVAGADKISADKKFSFRAEAAGEYKVVYSADAKGINGTEEIVYTVKSSLPVFGEIDLDPERFTGDTLRLPTVKATFGGKEYDTVLSVTDADGNVFSNKIFKAEKAGTYKIRYSFAVEGKEYSTTKTVRVLSRASDLFYGNAKITNEVYYMNDAVGGARVTVDKGNEKVYYKNDIDFSSKVGISKITSVIITPEKQGVRDFNELYVVLSDKANETRNVSFRIVAGEARGGNVKAIYVHGGAGVMSPGWKTLYSSFSAQYLSTHGRVEETIINLGIDPAAKCLYASTGSSEWIKVADLTDSEIFGSVWKGFSTDKAGLYFYANNLQAGTASFMITNVDGADLSGDYLRDYGIKPTIKVDYEGFDKSDLPFGVAGSEYPLFAATATDFVGNELNVETRVYRNYGLKNMYEVYSSDGKFVPQEAGVYTVEFKATDDRGNVATETYEVTVEENAVSYTIIAEGYADSATVGVFYRFGTFGTEANAAGLKLSETVYKDGQIVASSTDGFTPLYGGEYIIKLSVTDFLGNVTTKDVAVTATVADSPIFVSDPQLQYAFVNGNAYALPEVVAYDYYTDPANPRKAEITTELIVGEEKTMIGKTFTLNVPESVTDAKIRFTARSGDKSSTLDKDIKIVHVRAADGKVDLSKLFFSNDNVTAEVGPGKTLYKTNGDAVLYFANPVNADTFNFRFNVDPNYNNFSEIVVRLEDFGNPDVAVEIVICKNAANTTDCEAICGTEKGLIRGSFYGNVGQEFLMNYYNSSFVITDAENKQVLTVTNDVRGNVFAGFPSQIVRLSVGINGANGASGIEICSLNSRTFVGTTADRIKPAVVSEFVVKTIYAEGETVKIPAVKAVDTVDGLLPATVTLRGKNGFVTADDGTILNGTNAGNGYVLTDLSFGDYTLEYRAKDNSGNTAVNTVFFVVRDFEAPTLTLLSEIKNTAKVGETIVLPEYSVSDNGGEDNVTLTVFIVSPDYDMTVLKVCDDGKIRATFDTTGKFTIRYYLFDKFYNCSYYDYEVNVK